MNIQHTLIFFNDRNHKIIWYSGDDKAEVFEFVSGAWDQPPNFPHVTNLMQRAITRSQRILVQSFINQYASKSQN